MFPITKPSFRATLKVSQIPVSPIGSMWKKNSRNTELLTVITDREVDESDDNTLTVECVNSPRSRLVTAPAAECFRVLPSSAEVDDVLWTARHW